MRFEFIVALRYLRARRKQAVVSLITIISIIGVTAGVAALVIALSINKGFVKDLREKLLGARAHVTLLPAPGSGGGIPDYLEVVERAEAVEGVVSGSPVYYVTVLLRNSYYSEGVQVKGIVPGLEARRPSFASSIVEGGIEDFEGRQITLGRELMRSIGAVVGDRVELISAQLDSSPLGPQPHSEVLNISGAFETGLYDFDMNYAYVPIRIAQRLDGVRDDLATHIEIELEDLDQSDVLAPVLAGIGGPGLISVEWKSQNAAIFEALKLERLVMFITIGLIVIVASLNIVVTLVMMVMEKARDIAVLISMGATRDSIRRVFVIQGVVIGVIGTVLGLAIGNTAAYHADKYRLVSLSADVYSIAYVPFEISLVDSLIVGAGAILISYLATIYPSRRASGLQPVEALRYE
jgi:lipoprotein-releasing system permease protein